MKIIEIIAIVIVIYVYLFDRLNLDRSGGAWCPKQQIAENVKEYLQINFVNVSVISGIGTQGRYGNGRGQEYAEQFRLEYWRPELAHWRTYRRWDGNDVRDDQLKYPFSYLFLSYCYDGLML